MTHTPVFLRESLDALNLKKGSAVVDATLGSGGHSNALLVALEELGGGTLIGIDVDPQAIGALREKLHGTHTSVHLVESNFTDLEKALRVADLEEADAILADLGWRIEQFTEGGRGFSFQNDEPLLMTYGNPEDYAFTASDLLNSWEEADIANVLFGYGEERYARRIARAVVEARKTAPIQTTLQFVEIINRAVPRGYRHGRIHAATKSFQALRIAVNDELAVLKELINVAIRVLTPGGRLAIITFHSIEDRLVKEAFRELERAGDAVRIGKKPQKPTQDELTANPRARSAKLRVIEKTQS